MIRLRLAPAACAAAWMFACQSVAPLPPADPGVAIGRDDPRAVTQLMRFQRFAQERESLRATARLSLDAPGRTFSRPQRLLVQRPASLRIEVLGLFDQVVGVVVTNGVDFAFVDVASGARDAGAVDDGVLWRTARVDLTPADAAALLLGAPAIEPGAVIDAARAFQDGGLGVSLRAAERLRSRWLEWDGTGRVRRAELRDPDGAAIWVARYADWRELDGQEFAHRIDLEFPRVEATARVRFQAVELEPVLDPGLFVLQLAPGG